MLKAAPRSVSAATDGLHAILLAAGTARRYGSPKQLVRLAGRPLLQRALDTLTQAAFDQVSVVLGAHAPQVQLVLEDFRGTVIINPHWQEGIASSIRTAVARLPSTAAAAMILLADQPLVTAADVDNLVRAWRRSRDSIVAAHYAGVVAVPAIFPRRCFADLLSLRGDAGARHLLHAEGLGVLRVRMPNALVDIDSPEDLVRMEAR